jgi:hypothetical protein
LPTCWGCGHDNRHLLALRLKWLNGDSLVPLHMLAIDVSRRAIQTIGAARVRRRCPGSGKPPRLVEP